MHDKPSGKRTKGSVGVEATQGRLRFRLPRELYGGKQKYMALGLDDTPLNREIATQRAREMELDIKLNRFDPTLDKYRIGLRIVSPKELPFDELWSRYMKFKSLDSRKSSQLSHYPPIAKRVTRYGKAIKTKQDATEFLMWLDKQVSAETCRKTLQNLAACYAWGIDQGLVKVNPYEGLTKAIRKTRKKVAKPYTAKERDAIIQTIEGDHYYSRYAPLVKFLFATGCRTAEAAGLRWEHITPDCKQITFKETATYLSGKLHIDTTKTNEERVFKCPASLTELLLAIRPNPCDPQAPVFPSPRKQRPINMDNFVKRCWKQILAKAGVPYRRQYDTRSTFINFCLEAGVDAKDIAGMVGNSASTIYEFYAQSNSDVEIPDIFGDNNARD